MIPKNKIDFIKSPMNWPGCKYKYLNQLYPIFPNNINNFIDLFCGGLDVICNIPAIKKYANDIDKNLINIYKNFQNISFEELISFIEFRIKEFKLTRFNYEGFITYKDLYNSSETYHTPLDLFVLSRFSYNNLIEVKNDKFVGSFGFDRSDFNLTQRAHTKFLHNNIKDVSFSSINFLDFNLDNFTSNDFIYIDPPYLISPDLYNSICWNEEKEYQLYKFLDIINKEKNIKWAVSNLITHKGKDNEILTNWCQKYNVHDIYTNYSNSFSGHRRNTNDFSIEVLITNY